MALVPSAARKEYNKLQGSTEAAARHVKARLRGSFTARASPLHRLALLEMRTRGPRWSARRPPPPSSSDARHLGPSHRQCYSINSLRPSGGASPPRPAQRRCTEAARGGGAALSPRRGRRRSARTVRAARKSRRLRRRRLRGWGRVASRCSVPLLSCAIPSGMWLMRMLIWLCVMMMVRMHGRAGGSGWGSGSAAWSGCMLMPDISTVLYGM